MNYKSRFGVHQSGGRLRWEVAVGKLTEELKHGDGGLLFALAVPMAIAAYLSLGILLKQCGG